MEYPGTIVKPINGIIRIFSSFSGGNTSSVMTELLLKKYNCTYDDVSGIHHGWCNEFMCLVLIKIVFANTSREKEKTLVFVNNCDKILGFNTTWIETVMNHGKRKGPTATITKFEKATRDDSVFEEVIKKHGIPNVANPVCTRELKERPMHWYIKKILGWKPNTYYTAIGYRIDETHRFETPDKRKSAIEKKYFFPLADWTPMTKLEVLVHCEKRIFHLDLEEWEGNCKNCYKKSLPKLIVQFHYDPEETKWNLKIEEKYGYFTPPNRTQPKPEDLPWKFFREKTSTQEIIDLSNQYFSQANEGDEVMEEILKNSILGYPQPEEESGCTESCEAFGL